MNGATGTGILKLSPPKGRVDIDNVPKSCFCLPHSTKEYGIGAVKMEGEVISLSIHRQSTRSKSAR